MTRARPLHLFLFLLAVLQFAGISTRSFWSDEAYVGLIVTEPWRNLLSKLDTDVHHPLYVLIAKVWFLIAGNSEFALRSLSVFALLLGFWLFFNLVSALDSESAAIWASLFFVFSPALLLYGRMARYYSFSLLLFILALWLITQWERHSLRWHAPSYFFIMTASWFLTQPLGIVGAAHFLLLERGSRIRRKVFFVWLLSALTYALWLWAWRDLLAAQIGAGPAPFRIAFFREWGAKLALTLYQAIFGETVPALWVIAVAAFFSALFVLAGFRRPIPRPVLFAVLWLTVLTAVATFPIRVGTDFVPARVLFLYPAIYWLVGRGVATFRPSFQAPLALYLLAPMAVGLGFTYTQSNSLTSTYVTPWREVARFIFRTADPDDWAVADEVPLLYYRLRFESQSPHLAIVTQNTDLDQLMDEISGTFPPRIFVFFNPRDITSGKLTALIDWLSLGYGTTAVIPVVVEAPLVSRLKSRFAPSLSPVKRELRIYHSVQITEDPFATHRLKNLPEIPVVPKSLSDDLRDDTLPDAGSGEVPNSDGGMPGDRPE